MNVYLSRIKPYTPMRYVTNPFSLRPNSLVRDRDRLSFLLHSLMAQVASEAEHIATVTPSPYIHD